MNARRLAEAAVDQDLDARGFLPFVEEALTTDDPWIRAYAIDAWVLKIIQGGAEAWGRLHAFLAESAKLQHATYLLNVGRLGSLFLSKANPHRDGECAAIVLWLIEHDPSDPFLKNPYCYDMLGEAYALIAQAWSRVVTERANDVQVLANAAECFCLRDPAVSKSLFMRCQLLEPTNTVWSEHIRELEGR